MFPYRPNVEILNRTNPIATLSQLRTVMAPSVAASKVIKPRGVHPSSRGFYCCLQSPDGKACGLRRVLALGARVGPGGEMIPGGCLFGLAASLIPFPHHNPPVRNAFGAAMLQQAYPGSLPPFTDGAFLPYAERPLVTTATAARVPPYGLNLLVAVLALPGGLNQDDAIVLREGVLPRLDLTVVTVVRGPGTPPLPGTQLRKGDVVLGAVWGGEDAVVARVHDSAVEVHTQRRPAIGDKLCNRHGQKGVIGGIVADADLPRLGERPGRGLADVRNVCLVVLHILGGILYSVYRSHRPIPHFTADGTVPDVFVNPGGLARMTVGQLEEMRRVGDGTPWRAYADPVLAPTSDMFTPVGEEALDVILNVRGQLTIPGEMTQAVEFRYSV